MLWRSISAALVAFCIGVSSLGVVSTVSALDIPCESLNSGQCNLVKSKTSLSDNIWNIVSLAFRVLAGVAIIVIVIAGIMYTISNGDTGKVKNAKNIILYAVVGLVVALLASTIISFVIDRF